MTKKHTKSVRKSVRKCMTTEEKKASRRITNHTYYIKNHTNWRTKYAKSVASKTGTGHLGAHKLDDEMDEMDAINKEMIRLGLRKKAVY